MIRINALHFLLLLELVLLLCGIAGYLFLRAGKFRKLYNSMRDLETPRKAAGDAAKVSPVQTPPAGEKTPADELSALRAKIDDLQHIIDFQKTLVHDLLSSRDIFESAQQKLSSIHKSYQGLQSRIRQQGEAAGGKDTEGQADIVESGNRDLEKNISLLKAENEALSAKFNSWSDKMQTLWKSPAAAGQEALSGTGTDRVAKGSDELLAKVSELEGAVKEKDRLLKNLQTKLDSLEKEYLILYQQKEEQDQKKS